MPAYFDTNVIRYLRTGLNREIPAESQSRVVLSPVSAIEVLSQVADRNRGEEALYSIHRFREWLPEQTVLLDWLETFYAHHVFGMELRDEIFPIISEMLSHTLTAGHVDPALRQGAEELRCANETAKMRKARLFQEATDRLRADNLAPNELDQRVGREITLALAQRVNAVPNARTQAQVEQSLSAYCEFHRQSVLRAVRNVNFRFESREHLNDHFDGEQLLYLAVPEHHFISSDGGFNCVTNTQQGARIHIMPAATLQNPATAATSLERVLNACTPARPVL